ncbi:hypothetical protein ACERK3_04435 [Phycisphaerales bacterium AB-hyl4]|uniref:HEAT repeat protein n=1 Tax=Natronomicrosphaera hydrolytica TaxID=3242702 RepID=A0ABV4U1Q9_9BACT
MIRLIASVASPMRVGLRPRIAFADRPASATARLVIALAAMLAWALPFSVQADEPSDASEPTFELDAEPLLQHAGVLPDRINTAAWLVEPNVGRRLLALPLIITPSDDEAELGTSPSLSVRGGRFLMWMIEPVDAADESRRGRGAGRNQMVDMPDGYGYDAPQPARQQRQRGARDQGDDQLPPGAPRFARRVTIQPDGRVQWRLERSLPNAVLQDSQELYILRIRPDRLREMQPDRPGRMEAGGNVNRAELAQRRREAQRTFLEEQRAFNQLRTEVMNLPDEFELEGPARVWAIYEIADTTREINITGDQPSLPWAIGLSDLEALRSFAGAGGRRGGTERSMIEPLHRIVESDHPLSSRLVAYAVVNAGVINDIEPHDAMYNLFQTLLSSDDQITRRTVLTALIESPRPGSGALSLMRHASAQADPEMKLMSLRGILQGDLRDTNRLSQMVEATNEVLADRDGPDPALVLAELIEAVSDQREEAIVYVSSNLSFDRLSSDRLTSAVRYIVTSAGEHPLAAGWLDRQLLGNANPNIVEQTLEVIAAAATGAPWVREAAERGIAALFGPPDVEQAETETIDLTRRIPIHNANHAMFRSLNSGHERVRALAWQSLGNFEFAGDDRRGRFRPAQRGSDDRDAPSPYSELVDAALSQSPTPPQAVTFLQRQPDGQRAAAAMLRLLVEADEAAASQAARALVGSNWPLGETLASMSADERVQVGQLIYEHAVGQASIVAGLLAMDSSGRGRNNLPQWFGQRVAEGSPPMPGEWTEPFRNEDDLLELAISSDSNLAAGAVAALVYAAGGDDIAVQEQVDRFGEMSDAGRTELQSAWDSARQDIYARRLAESEGSYRVVALIHARGSRNDYDVMSPDGRPTQSDREPVARLTLGVVDLQADGRSISLSNDIVPVTLADRELAIRIERVHALQGFRDESLAELSLENVREPLDLAPQPDGSWVGSVTLRDGRRLELRMEPVE